MRYKSFRNFLCVFSSDSSLAARIFHNSQLYYLACLMESTERVLWFGSMIFPRSYVRFIAQHKDDACRF